jgi:dipeptidase D
MTSALKDLEPKPVWKQFEKLAAIPRPSTKEAAVRDYVLGLAKSLGLEAVVDAAGNVVVRKPATKGREGAVMAALQGHLDMVCEKNEGTAHNFDTDPIRLVRDGEWLKADGTTLGSDNGVGVAAALAVMEATDIAHGPLEFVFTIDEETGLTGASEFAPGVLKSKFFLNLDGEEKETIYIGCAGGVNTTARRKVGLRAAGAGNAYRVKVSGLRGGHSGVDIHQGRGNAVRVLGVALQSLLDKLPIEVAEVKGGSAHNAIPREAFAVVVLDAAREAELKSAVAAVAADAKAALGSFDPGVEIKVEATARPEKVLEAVDAKKVAEVLATMHHGVIAMSPDMQGLVQTSTNLATVATKGDVVEIITSQRSSIESSRDVAAKMVVTSFTLAGFEAKSSGGYPGWKPEPNSDIVQKLQAVHKEVFGAPAKLAAIHAGLECGVIGDKYPGMEMVSFGPYIINAHSPAESVEISTVESFWKFLKATLEKI